MNRFILIFFILSCFSCNSEQHKKKQEINASTLHAKHLNQYFETLVSQGKFNGAVLVMKEGNPVIFENFNMNQNAKTSLHTTKNAQFDIHSISKLMAKVAVVDLENQQQMSSNDLVSKYIPDFPSGNKITIQHLLDNQSGLGREFSIDHKNLINKNPTDLVNLIKKEKLLYEPGSDSSYSNLGYQLLYFIISKVTGKAFVAHLNDKYFTPLKMMNTGAHFYLNNTKPDNLVQNHEQDDNEIVIVPNIQEDDKSQAKIYSNINDLYIFLEYIKSPIYLNKIKNRNRNTIGWSGGGDGILSHVEHHLKANYELIFFSNYDEIPFGDIVLTVEKIMTDQPFELPQIINRQEKQITLGTLSKYTGKYRVREFNNSVFEFRIENNSLVFFQDGERNTILKAETDSTFFGQATDEDYFEFKKTKEDDYQLIYYYKKVAIAGKQINNK